MNNKPYLHELELLRTRNQLYNRWIDYALSLSRDDILEMIRRGQIYQVKALDSMIREIVAGRPVKRSLIKKLKIILSATGRSAAKLR